MLIKYGLELDTELIKRMNCIECSYPTWIRLNRYLTARGEGRLGEAQAGQPPLASSVKGLVYFFGTLRGHPLILKHIVGNFDSLPLGMPLCP